MNIRKISVALFCTFLVGMVGVYAQKTKTHGLQREQARLMKELRREQEDLGNLRANWSYLSRSSEIYRFFSMRSDLEPIVPAQIIQLDDLEYVAKFHASGGEAYSSAATQASTKQ